MSNIDILPATPDDFTQLALLNYHGFSGTPVNLLMFGGQSLEDQVANTKEYLKKSLNDPTCKLTKAVVDGIEEPVPRQRPPVGQDPLVHQGLVERLPRGTAKERAVEVDENRALGHGPSA